MRVITTDALPAIAFTLEEGEVDVSTMSRRVIVSGESARRIRKGFGERLSVRTFMLVDGSAGVELSDCYALGSSGEGSDQLTIIYRRRQRV